MIRLLLKPRKINFDYNFVKSKEKIVLSRGGEKFKRFRKFEVRKCLIPLQSDRPDACMLSIHAVNWCFMKH